MERIRFARQIPISSTTITPATGGGGGGYAENGVTFDGASWMTKSSNLAGSDGKTALIFVSVAFSSAYGGFTAFLLSQEGGNSGIYRHAALSGATGSQWRNVTPATLITMNGGTVIGAERANFLISLDADNTSKHCVWRTGGWLDEADDAAGGGVDLEFTISGSQVAIGSREGIYPFSGLMYRAVMWTGVTAPDAHDATTRNYFCDSSTGALVDPATSQGVYGQALFDFYGTASEWNATTANHGSSTGWTWTGAVT